MTDLLDFALAARGGLENWKGATGVDVRLTLGGCLSWPAIQTRTARSSVSSRTAAMSSCTVIGGLSINAAGEAVVDIFRLEDGKAVEHWDAIQPVPETSANANTMLGALWGNSMQGDAFARVARKAASQSALEELKPCRSLRAWGV
jgi:hypothetical protein